MGKVTGGLESDLCPTAEQPVSDSVQVRVSRNRERESAESFGTMTMLSRRITF